MTNHTYPERHPITGETTGCESPAPQWEGNITVPVDRTIEELVEMHKDELDIPVTEPLEERLRAVGWLDPLPQAEEPQATVTVTFSDGTVHTFTVAEVTERSEKEEMVRRLREFVASCQPKSAAELSWTPVDWTQGVDPLDEQMYNVTMANLWNPRKHAVANDLPSWHEMSEDEQWTIMRVFAGLTRLDTLQAEDGMRELIDTASSQHEKHILTLLGGVEVIHAQSYSFIFTSLSTSATMVRKALDWATNHPTMAEKSKILQEGYGTGDPLKLRIVSVMLESFAFFSGFFYPLYLASRRDPITKKAKLTETGVVVGAIVRDEATHGYYIGQKFQQMLAKLPPEAVDLYRAWTVDIFMRLYEVECRFTEDLYREVGLVDEVKKILCYNGNKAFQNLGFDGLFQEDEADADAVVVAAMYSGNNIDFFSTTSNDYKLADYEPTPEKEWAVKRRPGVNLFAVAQSEVCQN